MKLKSLTRTQGDRPSFTQRRELGFFLAAILALALTSTFAVMRVRHINPAILQDEWIYSFASKNVGLWEQDPPFDFGNYLFNLVYSSTALCGDAFYQCAKYLNGFFYFFFLLVMLGIALKYLPRWASLIAVVSIGLSPISAYVSMFLPETMYFAFLALAFFLLVEAIDLDSHRSWALVGIVLALASLVKPHGLLSLMAVGIFIAVYSLGRPMILKSMLRRGAVTLASFLVVRIVLGWALAGPKGIFFLSSYGAAGTLGSLAGGSQPSAQEQIPVTQVMGDMFASQLSFQIQSLGALSAISMALLVANVLSAFRVSSESGHRDVGVLLFVWLGTLVVAIVLFTGWVTASGDDHSTRILLRYYDFAIAFYFLVGLVLARRASELWAPARWAAVAVTLVITTPAFTVLFSRLTIQIADAPYLAGLVVDRGVLDTVAILGTLCLIVLAFFPRYLFSLSIGTLAITSILMGHQTVNQYEIFRGDSGPADLVGQAAEVVIPLDDQPDTLIIAQSRFDARVVSFWMDVDNRIELWPDSQPISEIMTADEPDYLILVGNYENPAGYSVLWQESGAVILFRDQ